jgi:WD40 repeat protein
MTAWRFQRSGNEGPARGRAGRRISVGRFLSSPLSVVMLAAGVVAFIVVGDDRGRTTGLKPPGVLTTYTWPIRALAFSGDGGRLVAAGADGSVDVWDFGSGRGRLGRFREGAAGGRLALSPDGRWLAIIESGGLVVLRETDGDAAHGVVRAFPESVGCVAFSPDGRLLAADGQRPRLRLFDPSTGRALWEAHGLSTPATAVAFSPDGRTLAAGGHDGEVALLDAADGRLRARVRGESPGPVLSLSIAPGGRTVAAASPFHDVALVRDVDAAATPSPSLPHPRGRRTAVAFSHDGRLLAWGTPGGEIELWDAAGGRLVETLRGHEGAVRCLAFSPDGAWLASGGVDGAVRLWSVGRRRQSASAVATSVCEPIGWAWATAGAPVPAAWDIVCGPSVAGRRRSSPIRCMRT